MADAAGTVESDGDSTAAACVRVRDRYDNADRLTAFADLLRPGASILDAGGAGVPVATFPVDGGTAVTGIEVSTAMIECSRLRVPEAVCLKTKTREIALDDEAFDGITAHDSPIHVAMTEHPTVLSEFCRVLEPGGVVTFSSGTARRDAAESWSGADMYWSHPEPSETYRMTEPAGLHILRSEEIERGGGDGLRVSACKPDPVPGAAAEARPAGGRCRA